MKTNPLYDQFVKQYGGKPSYAEATWKRIVRDANNARAIDQLRMMGLSIGAPVARGAFLFGSPGTGKSFLMKAKFNDIVNWKIENYEDGRQGGGSPYWAKFSDVLETMRNDDKRVKARAINSTWLFLDDLGTGTTTDWAIDQVFQILDERIEAHRQTFISSNYSLEQVAEIYSQRISSRIAELCVPIQLKGPDRRMKNLIENMATKGDKNEK